MKDVFQRSLRPALLPVAVAALVAAGPTSSIADESLPAVSEFNAKAGLSGGTLDSMSVYIADGTFTTPLTHSLGLQIDGLGGLMDGDGFGGGAAHLFWRDPSFGMFGLYGSGLANTAANNYTVGNVGIEGALYLGQFTVEGIVGAQFVTNLDADIFGTLVAAFYPIDDLRLHGGYRYWFGEHIGMAGFEWQLPGQNDNSLNFGLFADAQFREDAAGVWGGVRIYFGSQKPLIRRHREDDPLPFMPFDLTTFPTVAAGPRNTSQEEPECEGYPMEGYPMEGYPLQGYPVATATAELDIPVRVPRECYPYPN